MRHKIKHRKLNRTSSNRSAMMVNMAVALFKHERIHTTLPKAKSLRPYVEKLITKARSGSDSLHTRRQLLSKLRNNYDTIEKLVSDFSTRYNERNGGYTRIYKNGYRTGDNAPMAIIEFV